MQNTDVPTMTLYSLPFPFVGQIENGSEQCFLNPVQIQEEDIIHIYSGKYNVSSNLVLNEEFAQPLICGHFWKVPHISVEAKQTSLLNAFFLTLGLPEHSRLDIGNFRVGCILLQNFNHFLGNFA